jgi:diguanylate cyclase (GGDEF)-like protein/PAS domain S-box-containing protein
VRWSVRYVPFLLAAVVACGGVWLLQRWKHDEHVAQSRKDRVGAFTLLANSLQSTHGRLALMTAGAGPIEPVIEEEAKLRARLGSDAPRLYPLPAGDGEAARVHASVREYVDRVTRAADRSVDAVLDGRLGDAVESAGADLMPAEARLVELLERDAARSSRVARAASLRAQRSSVVTVVTMFGILAAIGVGTWRSDRRRAFARQHELRARERWSRALIEQSGDLVLVLDQRARVVFIGPGGPEMLGRPHDDIVDRQMTDFLRSGDASRFAPLWADLRERPGGQLRSDVTLARPDGSFVQVEAVCKNLLDDEVVRGVVVNARDVTARRRLEKQLVQRAFRDELTGLPNRAQFLDRLEHALTVANRTGERVAVLFLDLNGFKTVNDTLGHAAGDELLVSVAKRLRASVRPSDTVARLAGDEFTVLVEDVEDDGDALDTAARVVRALDEPIALADQQIRVGVSVGIAFGEPLLSAGDLLRNADTAMYEAKSKRSRSIVMWEPSMAERAWSRLELVGDASRDGTGLPLSA